MAHRSRTPSARIPTASDPSHPVGSYPHIPWYAIGCTLDAIAAQSNGRLTVEVIGQSALGRDMYLATINALDTKHQKQSFKNWQKFRKLALTEPKQAQIGLWSMHDKIKVPLYIQAGIHGDESEGIDASLQIIERLATTPYGTDPEVDTILDNAVVLFNVIHNPDGHIANRRQNGNIFDLNRDFLTQSQSETRASVAIMQEWLPPGHARSARLRDADADRGDDEAAQPEHRVRPLAEVEPGAASTPTRPR